MSNTKSNTLGFCILGCLVLYSMTMSPVAASEIDELRNQIQQRQTQIERIEQEIDKYKKQIQSTTAQKQTLKQKITELEATHRKLQSELEVTQNQIASTELTIDKLEREIANAKELISLNRKSVAELVRTIQENDETHVLEALLQHDSMSEVWGVLSTSQNLNQSLGEEMEALRTVKSELEGKRTTRLNQKEELEDLHSHLSSQENVIDYNKNEKETLLTQTQNKEAEYQRILEEKKKVYNEFKREINTLESQLEIAIDKGKYPEAGTSVFSYPLDDISTDSCWDGGEGYLNCVTQYFGNTKFAQNGAYNGNTHNGVDFRASIGEKIYSPAEGTVTAVGNTSVGRCLSYGKWILVEHPNGLTNLFAHLSEIGVSNGQQVGRGDIIGYAGNSGYSTGPHLHLSTLATEGVRIINMGDWYRESGRSANTPCAIANVRIPVAPHEAYLNPIHYF